MQEATELIISLYLFHHQHLKHRRVAYTAGGSTKLQRLGIASAFSDKTDMVK